MAGTRPEQYTDKCKTTLGYCRNGACHVFDAKERLMLLTPDTYLGYAADLAKKTAP